MPGRDKVYWRQNDGDTRSGKVKPRRWVTRVTKSMVVRQPPRPERVLGVLHVSHHLLGLPCLPAPRIRVILDPENIIAPSHTTRTST